MASYRRECLLDAVFRFLFVKLVREVFIVPGIDEGGRETKDVPNANAVISTCQCQQLAVDNMNRGYSLLYV